MEHVYDWCFHDIYKGGLWDDDYMSVPGIVMSSLLTNNCRIAWMPSDGKELSSRLSLCVVLLYACLIIEPRHEKTCLCYMRTTKAQISLRIRAV